MGGRAGVLVHTNCLPTIVHSYARPGGRSGPSTSVGNVVLPGVAFCLALTGGAAIAVALSMAKGEGGSFNDMSAVAVAAAFVCYKT